MSELSYIKVFLDWTEATRKLKDQEKGRLIDAMVAYAKGEDVEDRLSGSEAYVFPMFQLQLDRDRQEYADKIKKQRENGAKGGRPKKTVGFIENPKNPPVSAKTQKSQDKDKDKDNTPTLLTESIPPTRSKKLKFAEFVSMTQAEFDSLVAKYGNTTTNELVQILDNYKGSTGKAYKSDYRAILGWVTDKWREDQQKQRKKPVYASENPVSADDFKDMDRMMSELKASGMWMPPPNNN